MHACMHTFIFYLTTSSVLHLLLSHVYLRDWDKSLRSTFPEMYYQLILAYISSITVTTKTFGSRKHDKILMTPVTSLPDTELDNTAHRRLCSSLPKSSRQSPALVL